MRIRSIKPEYWRSQDIADLSWDHRLVFIGLWSYVDDNGVGRDDVRIITAELFALDSGDYRDILARVAEGLDALFAAGRIVRYEALGTRYLEIANWDKHQRIDHPNKARYPRSDAKSVTTLATPSRESRDTLAPGTGEQGNRGTGEQTTPKGVVARKRATTNGTRIPEPFVVTAQMRIDMTSECPNLNIDHATKQFVDYWRASSGKTAVKKDWVSAWRYWMRKDYRDYGERTRGTSKAPTRGEENLAYLQRVMDEERLEITS